MNYHNRRTYDIIIIIITLLRIVHVSVVCINIIKTVNRRLLIYTSCRL